MVLWLDTDANTATGCAGFDFVVNRSRVGKTLQLGDSAPNGRFLRGPERPP
jgi:hypothetical protein